MGRDSGCGGCRPRQAPSLHLPSTPLGSWLSSTEPAPRPLLPAAGGICTDLSNTRSLDPLQFTTVLVPKGPVTCHRTSIHSINLYQIPARPNAPNGAPGLRVSRASSISPGSSKLPKGRVMSSSLPRATAPLTPTQTLPIALSIPSPLPFPLLLPESKNLVLHTGNLLAS